MGLKTDRRAPGNLGLRPFGAAASPKTIPRLPIRKMLVLQKKSVYLEPTEAPNMDKATIILILDGFLIENVDFSLEKCIFGAHRNVLHYVLRQELALFQKNANFSQEICVKERGGRTALQPEASLSLK